MHTVCDTLETLWQAARKSLGAGYNFFNHIRTIVCYMVFPKWAALIRCMISGRLPSQTKPP